MSAAKFQTERKFVEPEWATRSDRFDRFWCRDVSNLGDQDLLEETWFFRARVWPLPADSWQRQRLVALEDELRRRHPGARR